MHVICHGSILGTCHIRTTAYHFISNGLVEHFHCQLKGELKCPPGTTDSLNHSPWYMCSCQTRLQMHCCRISLWHHPEATRRFLPPLLHPRLICNTILCRHCNHLQSISKQNKTVMSIQISPHLPLYS